MLPRLKLNWVPNDEKRVKIHAKREFQTISDSDARDMGQTLSKDKSKKKDTTASFFRLNIDSQVSQKAEWTFIWVPQSQMDLMNTSSFQK